MESKSIHRLFLLACLVFIGQAAKTISISSISCEHLPDPVGLGTPFPRLSWVIVSGGFDQVQTAYQVLVASSPDLLNEKKSDLWNSGKVKSNQSILVDYTGKPLSSRDECWWRVRVWDKDGKPSSWSETGFFEIGLLSQDDWKANWIKADLEMGKETHWSPMLRKEFNLGKEIAKARLYISSLGLYEADINDKKVGDQVLTPGWTSYRNRVQYQTYDVTSMVKTGDNAIGVILGDGWYRDFWKEEPSENQYGSDVSLDLIAQLEIIYTDGTSEMIVTNDSWRSTRGPILASTIYNGETYDARLEKTGWSKPGYNDGEWFTTSIAEHAGKLLVHPASPAMKKIGEIKPIEILITPERDTVLDMGQNMVGWIRLKINAPAGTSITLRHAEVLDSAGNFYIENLRAAAQTNNYICKGGGTETWEPRFTFQGFRYVAVTGIPGELTPDMITGVVVHSNMEKNGTFSCNNKLINQLQHNIVWGQKGNFVDVPTDCPQRDERLGWTGDAQVFAPTACFNMNCAGFYIKWLRDLALDQHENGAVPKVIPNILPWKGGECGWQDAATIVPWTVYRYYGDEQVLKEQYPSMKELVEYMRGRAGDAYIWGTRTHHYGDWLSFATTRSDYPGATTDKDLLASAYFYHSTNILQQTADILGYEEDAVSYRALMGKIKAAFGREYLTPNGRLSSNTQTAYVVALSFGIIPVEQEEIAAKRLAEDVRRFGHLTTGFLGTPDLCHVLTNYGYLDEAYMLLYRQEYPSWLYPVTQGATTIWERWDGQKPDGSFQDPGMNSFNHYAYGAVGDWLYRKVAGMDIGTPGFKSIIIKPHPGEKMNDVKASHESPYGTIRTQWEIKDERFHLTVTIPVNTRAKIHVPSTGDELISGGRSVSGVNQKEGPGYKYLVVERGSGTWTFESPFILP